MAGHTAFTLKSTSNQRNNILKEDNEIRPKEDNEIRQKGTMKLGLKFVTSMSMLTGEKQSCRTSMGI